RDWSSVVFFFQADDGIRDFRVTGVQTCALPSSTSSRACGCSSHSRQRTPMHDPAKAATNQTHPCRLPEDTPLKKAPTLQPKAIRALYPSTRPASPITTQLRAVSGATCAARSRRQRITMKAPAMMPILVMEVTRSEEHTSE